MTGEGRAATLPSAPNTGRGDALSRLRRGFSSRAGCYSSLRHSATTCTAASRNGRRALVLPTRTCRSGAEACAAPRRVEPHGVAPPAHGGHRRRYRASCSSAARAPGGAASGRSRRTDQARTRCPVADEGRRCPTCTLSPSGSDRRSGPAARSPRRWPRSPRTAPRARRSSGASRPGRSRPPRTVDPPPRSPPNEGGPEGERLRRRMAQSGSRPR